jgi:hypothetical protein
MPPAEFEPTIAASKRPQNHASDHAATGIGTQHWLLRINTTHYVRYINRLASETEIQGIFVWHETPGEI